VGTKISGKWAILGLAMVLLLVVVGCSSREEKTAEFISKGDKLLSSGDPVLAVLEYKNALQLDPKSARANLGLGKAYLQQKDPRKAYGAFQGALELDPTLDEARLEVASLLAAHGEPQKALDEIQKIAKPAPWQPRLDITRARALVALKQYKEALAVLKALKESEGNPDVQGLLSIAFKETGDFGAMELAAGRWRTAAPQAPHSYLFMAQYAAGKGDRARAVRELDGMVQANPGESGAFLLKAQALEGLNLMEEAEAAYAALPSEPQLLKARVAFLMKRGKTDDAGKVLKEVLDKNPRDVDALLQQTQLLVVREKKAEALEVLEKALQTDIQGGDRERFILAKATLKAAEGDTDTAMQLCNDVLKQNQGNLDAHLLLGNLLLAYGRTEEAETHLNQAAVGKPNDPKAQILLARSQRFNKKENMARDTLKNAVHANPANVELRLELVRDFAVKKEMDQALKTLDQGLEITGDDAVLLKTRGELLASQKDWGRAQKDFEQILKLRPDSPLGYLEMGRLALAQSRQDEAIGWLKKAMDKEGGWQAALPMLARIHLAKGDRKAAVDLVEAQVAARVNAPQIHLIYGQVLAATGDLPKAEAALKLAADLAPDWFDPYPLLTEVYRQQGKIAEAIVRVEKAYNRQPTVPLGAHLAMLCEQEGRISDAIRIYEEALTKSRYNPLLLNNLAFLYADHSADAKDLEKAAQMAAQALAVAPENPNFMDTVAWVAFKRGNVDLAWGQIQNALAQAPDAPSHNLHAAMIARARGDKQAAGEYLKKALDQDSDQPTLEQAKKLKQEWGN
jgi:tetratricopeptide (TPR) repeat protein